MKNSSFLILFLAVSVCCAEDSGWRGHFSNEIYFSFDEHLQKNAAGRNYVFSPFSVFQMLGIVYSDAKGESSLEMSRLLSLPADKEKFMNEVENNYSWLGKEDVFKSRNLVLLQKGAVPSESLKKCAEGTFKGSIIAEDLMKPSEALSEKVKAWVKENTKGMIEYELPAKEDLLMAVFNAWFFSHDWNSIMKRIGKKPFRAPQGEVSVEFMEQGDRIPYAKTGGFEAIAIPYADKVSDEYLAVIIKPVSDADINSLSKETCLALLENLERENVTTMYKLPLVEIKQRKSDLIGWLDAKGVRKIFDMKEDSFQSVSPAYVGVMETMAYLKVDEKGTQAGGLSVGLVYLGGAAPTQKRDFVCDRPFKFIVVHNYFKTILFSATVYDPSQN